LFCDAQALEDANIEYAKSKGKDIYGTYRGDGKRISTLVEGIENQKALPGMEDLEYPPCQCGL
jgi:hypothetical protein